MLRETMLNRILAILAISLIAGSGVYAAEVCCNTTLPKARILALQPSPQFGDIVRKDASSEKYCPSVRDTGNICYMTQQKAIDYCAAQEMHLPSARELAQLAASPDFGAKGILEVEEYQQKKDARENVDGYYLIGAQNGSAVDRFYFSFSGYKRPKGDLGDNSFWSSSFYPNYSDYAFFLNGSNGYVFNYYYLKYVNAVRCVAGR